MLKIGHIVRLKNNGDIGKIQAIQVNNIDKEVNKLKLKFEDTGISAWFNINEVKEI